VFGPPMTAASVRTIPLPQVVVEALAEHIRVAAPARKDSCSSAPTGWPCAGPGGPAKSGVVGGRPGRHLLASASDDKMVRMSK
jgi:hypothetical protein